MDNIYFDKKNHEFDIINKRTEINEGSVNAPLSLILQVTRRCNLGCVFCSESEQIPDPSISVLESLIGKLKGVERLYLSGGEPFLRRDIFEIIDIFRPHFKILGLPTNTSMITDEIGKRLFGKIDYINAGLDGPRLINDKLRGNTDAIIKGLLILKKYGIEVSLSTVILKSTLPYLDYVVQIADTLDITKVKMVIPVLRGRATEISENEFANETDILSKFEQIKKLKDKLGWKPRIKFAFWDKNTEGYALIVYPNQKVYAWPVYEQPEAVLYIGDLNNEDITSIWSKYPYKLNHIKKYAGISMHKA